MRVLPLVPAGRFVGRESELAALLPRLERAWAGAGGVALVAGEPGIGKTRLVRELADHARSANAGVLWATCHEGAWRPPYAPWVELARQLGPGRLAGLAGLVPEAGGGPPVPSLAPEEAEYRVYEAFSRLFTGKDEPRALILDDLHWADPGSLGVLAYLARTLADSRVLVVAMYRDEEVTPALERCLVELTRLRVGDTIRLGSLGRDETRQLAEEVHGGPIEPATFEVLWKATGGHPFFVEEVARDLRQADGELGVPASVRYAVRRRVGRLSAEAGRVLALAAGFGGAFEPPVLVALTELSEERLLDALDEAAAAGLVRPAGDGRFELAHALVRQTLYEDASPSRRARLHRRIAQAIERVHAGRELEHAAQLAAQYHASAALPGAADGVPYALAAADRARGAFAREQAVGLLRMALELAPEDDVPLRVTVLRRLAIAQAEAVMIDDALQTVDQALAALERAGVEPGERAELVRAAAWALEDAGAREADLLRLVSTGLDLLDERRDLTWARLKLVERPVEPLDAGIVPAARWLGFDPEAVRIARASGEESDYARTLDVMDWRTRAETDALLALIHGWADAGARIRGLSVVMRSYAIQHGAFREAIAVGESLLEYARQAGSLSGEGYALFYLSDMHAVLGDFAVAGDLGARAAAVAGRLGPGHRLAATVAQARWVAARLIQDDWPAFARRYYASALNLEHPAWMRLSHATIAAYAFARAGEPDEARALLTQIVPAVLSCEPTTLNQNAAVCGAATACWELEEARWAAPLRRAALELIEAGVGNSWMTSMPLSVARMAALLGDRDEALDYYERARREEAYGGRRPMQVIVDIDEALGRHRLGEPGVPALAERAQRRAEELGMRWWADRARRLRELAGELPPDRLSRREAEVLGLMASGKTNKEIAAELVLSVRTVERHLLNAYGKIGARGRADAAAYAARHGL